MRIVTHNLDLTEWDQAFPSNRLLAPAALDRLRHNAYCLVLDNLVSRPATLAFERQFSRQFCPLPQRKATGSAFISALQRADSR